MATEINLEKGPMADHNEISVADGEQHVMGTTRLGGDDDEIFLVPAPSADPRDPLNLPRWRKVVFVIILSIFSALGLSLVVGFGGLLGFYIPEYTEHGATYADITALMTYSTMFMGVGNLVCMPLALAVGRRAIYLGSVLVKIMAALLAAYSESYNWQLDARMVLGLAVGNSEALVPLMIQEIHFVHERSTVYTLFASPIAGAIGPDNCHTLGAGLGGVCFILSVFLVPESRYRRSLQAYGQETEGEELSSEKPGTTLKPITLSQRPALDFERYEARTIWSDMRLFVGPPDWSEGLYCIRNIFQVMLFPNVLWAFCLNGLTLGTNIAIGTTYGSILSAPLYNWPDNTVSYINIGQIVVSILALPLLGIASDKLIQWRARRNEENHEPKARMFTLIPPICFGVVAATLYGQVAT